DAVARGAAHVGRDVVVLHRTELGCEDAKDAHLRPAFPSMRSLMMCCWIWLVPSKIVVSRASRQCRSPWRWVVYPLPPWSWMPSPVTSTAISVATSLTIAASFSHA